MNIQRLRLHSSLLGKKIAPKDTYNLAGSIYTVEIPNGYSVIQPSARAFYGEIINDGRTDRPLTAKEKRNVGWWDTRVYNGIVRLVATNQNYNQKTYQEIAGWAKNTPARQQALMRSIARSGR